MEKEKRLKTDQTKLEPLWSHTEFGMLCYSVPPIGTSAARAPFKGTSMFQQRSCDVLFSSTKFLGFSY